MRLILLSVAAAIVLCGCGESNVTVGEPGQKGIVRTDIDHSRATAQAASDRVHQGEQDLGN
jgi:hypothetical protein